MDTLQSDVILFKCLPLLREVQLTFVRVPQHHDLLRRWEKTISFSDTGILPDGIIEPRGSKDGQSPCGSYLLVG